MFFWVGIIRGIFALALGAAELVAQDAVRPMVINFLGVFLLTGGIAEIRSPDKDEAPAGLGIAASLAAIVAGACILARFLLLRMGPEVIVVYMLAAALLIAGALHAVVGRHWWDRRGAVRSSLNIALGLVELGLGAVLIASPLERGLPFHGLLTAWAILAGPLLLMKAWASRSEKKDTALKS